jgi:2-polyprenyl-3-methyl-5-hydroxy-6-metoxy-1,4-benzoquinol methylase
VTAVPTDIVQQWPAGLEAVPHCPVCGREERLREADDLSDKSFGCAPGKWSLKRCPLCRSMFLDPRPDAQSLHLAYRNYYTHAPATFKSNIRAWLSKAIGNGYRNRIFGTSLRPSLRIGALVTPLFSAKAARIRADDRGLGRAVGEPRRILDVGCGNGQFLQMVRQMGWRGFGVETDAAAAAVARSQGSEIIAARLDDLGPEHDSSFDAVTLSHVIEHVPTPLDLLRDCWRLLKPGGYLWLETPNADSMGYEIYGSNWRGLEAPRHLVLFTAASLQLNLRQAGFERIRILPPVDVTSQLFLASAAMKLGRIAEIDPRPLPKTVRDQTLAQIREASRVVAREPGRSEFVAAIAYRPATPTDTKAGGS